MEQEIEADEKTNWTFPSLISCAFNMLFCVSWCGDVIYEIIYFCYWIDFMIDFVHHVQMSWRTVAMNSNDFHFHFVTSIHQ